jgi:hypothetical protein
MVLFPIKIGMVCRYLIDKTEQFNSACIIRNGFIILTKGGVSLFANKLIESPFYQGYFFIGQINPKSLVHKAGNILKLLIADIKQAVPHLDLCTLHH